MQTSSDPVRMAPWRGTEYELTRPRLSIIGESHYDARGPQPADYTQGVVRDHVFSSVSERRAHHFRRSPFFSKVASLVSTGARVSETELRSFWGRVAFANLVQEIVGDDHHTRPTPAMWADARRAFLPLLEIMQPDIAIVCGQGVWDHLPAPPVGDVERAGLEVAGHWLERTYYRQDGRPVRVVRIDHPATRGWRADDWRPRVHALLGGSHASDEFFTSSTSAVPLRTDWSTS